MNKLKVILIKKDAHLASVSSPHMDGHFATSKEVEPLKLAKAFLIMFSPPHSNPQIRSDDGMGTAFYFTETESPK